MVPLALAQPLRAASESKSFRYISFTSRMVKPDEDAVDYLDYPFFVQPRRLHHFPRLTESTDCCPYSELARTGAGSSWTAGLAHGRFNGVPTGNKFGLVVSVPSPFVSVCAMLAYSPLHLYCASAQPMQVRTRLTAQVNPEGA